jgi:hypothetical protein
MPSKKPATTLRFATVEEREWMHEAAIKAGHDDFQGWAMLHLRKLAEEIMGEGTRPPVPPRNPRTRKRA